ncbi:MULTISPECIES: XdhC family protein [unclassified Stenotrophomonas]|uniref:XdhC family protein n=1 Tax=unclassified Stenotrophomonas TaxID=196198 RepID=UPI0034659A67
MNNALHPAPLDLDGGNPRPVLLAAADAARAGRPAALAVVLQTEGSSYSRAGTCALFEPGRQVGWLSGGCLEPELARQAANAVDAGRIAWMEIDSRDDAALFSGNATGCRGRQWLALLPLPQLGGIELLLDAWLQGPHTLYLALQADGRLDAHCGAFTFSRTVPAAALQSSDGSHRWRLQWHRSPVAHMHGAGPEAALLLLLLDRLGWCAHVEEPRPRWREHLSLAGGSYSSSAAADVADAALVMHHNFELDRDALQRLADSRVPFIGLLGPRRRKDDLFSVLDTRTRLALEPRLRSPIGLPLGGRGPEAIALSVAAQLQAWRHGTPLAAP